MAFLSSASSRLLRQPPIFDENSTLPSSIMAQSEVVVKPAIGGMLWKSSVSKLSKSESKSESKSSRSVVARPSSSLSVSEDGLERYMAEVRKAPMLEREEEYMLARRWIAHKDVEAAHRLVLSHLRLVAKIASGYRGYGLPYAELVSEGNIGLLQAVRRFDPERGFRLATYAIWWIRAAVQDYVLRSWSLVKIGTTASQKKLFFNLRKLRQQMRAIDSQQINAEEVAKIAAVLDVEAQEVEMMHARLSVRDLSLQTPVGEDGDAWQEWIEDESADHEGDFLEKDEHRYRRSVLNDALQTLKVRERDILRARRLQDPAATLDALSKHYRISRERVRQIEVAAFEKLRLAVAEKERSQLEQLPAPSAPAPLASSVDD